MSPTLEYLLVEERLPAAVITLNRPDQLNPLSTGLMKELTSELERQAARPEVRAIVLKGAGRAFSAGHDLREMADRSLDEEREIFAVCNKLMALVAELAKLSRYALTLGKEGFYKQVDQTQAEAYRLMAEAISCNAVAPDGKEGIAAFVEKRSPVWTT